MGQYFTKITTENALKSAAESSGRQRASMGMGLTLVSKCGTKPAEVRWEGTLQEGIPTYKESPLQGNPPAAWGEYN